jgi:hypothetical protein
VQKPLKGIVVCGIRRALQRGKQSEGVRVSNTERRREAIGKADLPPAAADNLTELLADTAGLPEAEGWNREEGQ